MLIKFLLLTLATKTLPKEQADCIVQLIKILDFNGQLSLCITECLISQVGLSLKKISV